MSPIEDQIRQYFALQGKGLDVVDSRGLWHAERCGALVRLHGKRAYECRSKKRTERDAETVCAECGARWRLTEYDVPKRWVQRSAQAGEVEQHLAEHAALGHALNDMLGDRGLARWRRTEDGARVGGFGPWTYPTMCLVAHALTARTWREIAEHANANGWMRGPRCGPWTEAAAEGEARAARRELLRRLGQFVPAPPRPSRATRERYKFLRDQALAAEAAGFEPPVRKRVVIITD